MRRRRRISWMAASLLVAGLCSCGGDGLVEDVGPPPPSPLGPGVEGVSLFNGRDFAGWSTFVQPGPEGGDPRKDPRRVFRAEGGLIHVTGERFGLLTTEAEHGNYRLTLQFRWGRKRWPPREEAVRDSGVLVHLTGPEKVWPRSIECQIQEHDCGDFWTVDGATLEVDGRVVAGRAVKARDAERPTGEWNTVEVVCDGDAVTNIINGVVVNRGTRASADRGRIALQSEGAEVFFANVVLRPLGPRPPDDPEARVSPEDGPAPGRTPSPGPPG